MKSLTILTALLFTLSSTLFAQTEKAPSKTNKETVQVWGNCGMCKGRIEKTAKEAGADKATWNEETKKLTVSFNSGKTSLKAIEEKIASVGHDTENFTAPDEVYKKLHGCCQYDRKAETEQPAKKD